MPKLAKMFNETIEQINKMRYNVIEQKCQNWQKCSMKWKEECFMDIIQRQDYLNKLIVRKENGLIKILTGIRRCGKSFMASPAATEATARRTQFVSLGSCTILKILGSIFSSLHVVSMVALSP